MNIKTTAISLTALTLSSAFFYISADEKIGGWRISQPEVIRLPAMSDSINAEGSRFSVDRLLGSHGDLKATLPLKMDSTVMLAGSSEGMNLYTLTTRLRADRFLKGKIKVNTTAMADVLIDGKSIGKISAFKDSLNDSGKSFNIELLPERVTDLSIRILTDKGERENPLSVVFVPDEGFDNVTLASDPDMRARFSIEATTLGLRVTKTALSPDGRYLLLYYKDTYSGTKSRSYASLLETATGNVIVPELDPSVEWMPEDNALWFTKHTPDGGDLFRMDVPSLKRTLVAEKLPAEEFMFAPDGKSFIYLDMNEGKQETAPMHRYTDPDDRIPGNRQKSNIMLYDLATSVSRPLTYGRYSDMPLQYSPDGRKLLYYTVRETPSQYPFYATSLIEMDLATLATDTIVKGASSFSHAVYSPDGKRLFITAGPTFMDNLGAACKDCDMPNDFDVQGYIADIASRKITPVTKDFDPSLYETSSVWSKADGKIYFRARDGFYTRIYSYDPEKQTFKALPVDLDNIQTFSIPSEKGMSLSYTGQSYVSIGRAYVLNLKNGSNKLVSDPMQNTVDGINFGETGNWSFTATDGTVIDGTFTLPPDFDPSKKYPLIVYYYGGTLPSDRAMGTPYSPQLFASRDYVVYVLNPSGTVGYGQDFSARHVNAWGNRTADDIIEGVKEFCKQHPFVDDKKIGCLGASYGGFMTQYLQTQTDIFAAAVSHAGISNVTSYWGEGYWGYSYNSVAAAKSYPWTDPELFTKQGSLFNADKIHTPLLLLHGTVDTNVPIGESIQLFNALKILGRDVEFITVEDQNHVILDYDKRKVWQATIMAWFAKWLQDDPRWWDSMYGK